MKSKFLQKKVLAAPKDPGLLTTNNQKTLKPYEPALVNTENRKTRKGEEKGYLTGIMHLMPSDLSGHGNVCPSASPECRDHCLNTAGTWSNSPHVQNARERRTKLYFEDRPKFLDEMRKSIEGLVRQAKRKGLTPAIRINGTSDLPGVARQMAKEYPDVQFYDYTKLPRPWNRTLPNYHITYSRSENNEKHALEALKHNIDVAVVFDVKKGESLPQTWKGYPVIDGDKHDLRFLDKHEGEGPFIVGLRAKGKARAKGSESGFVVKPGQGPQLVSIKPLPKAEKSASEKKEPHVEYYTDDMFFEAPSDEDDGE
jgi:hypothetical protein